MFPKISCICILKYLNNRLLIKHFPLLKISLIYFIIVFQSSNEVTLIFDYTVVDTIGEDMIEEELVYLVTWHTKITLDSTLIIYTLCYGEHVIPLICQEI